MSLNIFGLALGLASAILIFLYVSNELQYDYMHPYYADTYRIGSIWKNADGRIFENKTSPGYWAKQLRDTRSEVRSAIRVSFYGYPTSLNHKAADRIILTEELKWAEPGFDKILMFDLIKGSKENFFDNPNSVVISESGAKRLFGDADPVGQIISVKHAITDDKEIDVAVTGVYRDYPSNSHFKPLYIVNINALRTVYGDDFVGYLDGGTLEENDFFENYVVINPGADIKQIESSLQLMADQMVQADSSSVAAGWKLSAFLTKLSDLHFDQRIQWESGYQGDKEYLMIFSGVAVLTLLIACINYMNLATARAARRAKEVGLRKSLGSERRQIAFQFFCESALLTLCSMLIALILVIIFLPLFSQLAYKTFTLASLLNPYMIGTVAVIVIFMALISGSYPAIYLSSFQPVEVLKGQVVHGAGADVLRKTLVAIQYTVSLVLIIITFVVVRQMDLLQTSKLNQLGGQLLSVRYGTGAPSEKFFAFKQAVLKDPDIAYVTIANHLPRLEHFGPIDNQVKFPEFENKELQWSQLNVEYDFAKTYQLEFVAGRDFDANNPSDSSSIILNEAAVKSLNQTIDKIIGTSVIDLDDYDRSYRVIGIVKDFHYKSMHHVIGPLLIYPHILRFDRIVYIKIPPGKFNEEIEAIEKIWKDIFPGVGFDYWFVSDEFNRMYKDENRIASLAKTFSMLGILITVLGVFGLASYTAEQKKKEIGIRKVLGAGVGQVIIMFTWIFVKILLISSVVAFPTAYFLTNYWLEGFAYRSALSPITFAASVAGLLIVTLLTVGFETWKAAKNNPVKSLRSE